MPLYRYSAVDLESRATSGLLEAESAREAREALRARRLIATRLEPALSRRRFHLLRRLSQRDRQELTLATSQVATLIDTGTGSLKAIRTVA
ncbi:MAG TPA: type II secretion system protein GspF, partial [Phycisphaerae bacterium]|nr:type II secretion system protein GspF [Phycisphaerae bacterium]